MDRIRPAEPDSSDDESEADEEDEETDDEYAAPAPAPAPAPTPAPVPSLDQWINVTGHTDAGLAAAGGGRPVEPLDEEQDDDGHDFSLLPNSPLVPAPYPVPAIDEPSITWEDMRAELFRVANLVNRMEPNSPLMDTKWFTLLSALHDC